MSRGILIFAKNNEKFNYVKQAAVAALSAKKHLDIPVCVIALEEELATLDPIIRKKAFDIEINKSAATTQKRSFLQGQSAGIYTWHNELRSQVYDFTPFDETILIDSDYIIQNDVLNSCWGSVEPIMMNTKELNIVTHIETPAGELRTSVLGPKMYWATCVYFKKTKKTEIFFNLVKHIQENYLFYSLSYNLPSRLFRNDYAFTIAAHVMHDTLEDCIPPLPVQMLNCYPADEILQVTYDSILMNASLPVRISKMNVHIMNKYSLEEHLDDFLKVC